MQLEDQSQIVDGKGDHMANVSPKMQTKTIPDNNRGLKLTAANREALWGFFFVSPWIIGFLLFSLFPIFAVLYLGFTEYTVLQPPKWVGWSNFTEMFSGDRLYFTSLYNTAYYIALRVPSWILVGLGSGDAPEPQDFRHHPLPDSFLFTHDHSNRRQLDHLAVAAEPADRADQCCAAPIWHCRANWLHDITWAKPAIVALGVWQVGQTMMIFLAGLQEIPDQLYEAAKIDGANHIQQFFAVTLPMMTPTIYFNTVTGVIAAFQVFGSAFIMTGGGPVNSTLFYVLYLYRRGFQFLEMGYASAMAVVLFLLILLLTVVIVRTSDKWVKYERI